jgi:isoleucyl-tRNA synthetase
MREADLIDVWFDSGSMPYAQWHYPLKTKKNRREISQLILLQKVSIKRGWFYTLHAIGTLVLIK